MKLLLLRGVEGAAPSHPSRGAWIEIAMDGYVLTSDFASHPSRGAWIEIISGVSFALVVSVAPLTGCVD